MWVHDPEGWVVTSVTMALVVRLDMGDKPGEVEWVEGE
jgi:hypothetical protein